MHKTSNVESIIFSLFYKNYNIDNFKQYIYLEVWLRFFLKQFLLN